jgi:hypothetical protein
LFTQGSSSFFPFALHSDSSHGLLGWRPHSAIAEQKNANYHNSTNLLGLKPEILLRLRTSVSLVCFFRVLNVEYCLKIPLEACNKSHVWFRNSQRLSFSYECHILISSLFCAGTRVALKRGRLKADSYFSISSELHFVENCSKVSSVWMKQFARMFIHARKTTMQITLQIHVHSIEKSLRKVSSE